MGYDIDHIDLPIKDVGVVLAEASLASFLLPEGYDSEPYNRTTMTFVRAVISRYKSTDLPPEVAVAVNDALFAGLVKGDITPEEASELTGEPVEDFKASLQAIQEQAEADTLTEEQVAT